MARTVPLGSEIACKRPISGEIEQVAIRLTTVADLMQILGGNPPRKYATMTSACAAWQLYLGKDLSEIPIESLFDQDTRKGFRPFLANNGPGYKESSIRTYVDMIRLLAKQAKELGLTRATAPEPEWGPVLEQAKKRWCAEVALYFASLMAPREVTVKDTDAHLKKLVDEGGSYYVTKGKIARFWRLLRDLNLNGENPSCLRKARKYGVRFNDMPPELKADLVGLLEWLVAKWAIDRPDDRRIRAISAGAIRKTVGAILGFAMERFPGLTIKTVPQLFIHDIVEAYVAYAVNERGADGHPIRKQLQRLCAAMRDYPKYQPVELGWCKKLLATLPKNEDKEKIKSRKRKTKVDHKYLRLIPSLIHELRRGTQERSIRRAVLVRDELLMTWLLYLPWRQRNIREIRIGGSSPNLFKGPIESAFEKPRWVIEEEERNPAAEFWQIQFSKEETKMNHGVEAVLPRALVPLLEEYLRSYRQLLLGGQTDPATLFLTEKGKSLSMCQVTDLVETLTLRHASKAVNPHRFRDLFAYAWLCDNPRDYLTLSKILWHKSVQVTIDIYGAEFGIANGVAATEVWSSKWQ